MEQPSEPQEGLTATSAGFVLRGDHLVIPSSGEVVADQDVRDVRLECQRGADQDGD